MLFKYRELLGIIISHNLSLEAEWHFAQDVSKMRQRGSIV